MVGLLVCYDELFIFGRMGIAGMRFLCMIFIIFK